MGRNSLLCYGCVRFSPQLIRPELLVIRRPERRCFGACAACHTLEPGEHRTGPSLAGVFGRKAGTAEGFHRYSDALKSADLVWREDTLDGFLADPRAFLPGNRMTFSGIADAQARADVIAYLQDRERAAGARPRRRDAGGMMAAPELADLRRESVPKARIASIRYCGDTYDGHAVAGRGPSVLGVQPPLQDQLERQGTAPGPACLLPASMMGDRAFVIFAGARRNQRLHQAKC